MHEEKFSSYKLKLYEHLVFMVGKFSSPRGFLIFKIYCVMLSLCQRQKFGEKKFLNITITRRKENRSIGRCEETRQSQGDTTKLK